LISNCICFCFILLHNIFCLKQQKQLCKNDTEFELDLFTTFRGCHVCKEDEVVFIGDTNMVGATVNWIDPLTNGIANANATEEEQSFAAKHSVCVGRVFVKYEAPDGEEEAMRAGTAFVVSPHLAITAAHNICDTITTKENCVNFVQGSYYVSSIGKV